MLDFMISAFADEAAESLSGQIAALKRNRISLMEIRNVDGKCIIDLSDRELSRVRSILDENEIGVSAIASPIGKISITEEFAPHFGRFRRAVTAAKLLGTDRIRMFSFFLPAGTEAVFYRDKVLERLHSLCEYAADNGVYCYHENEKEIFGDISERVKDLHRELGGAMKGIFDPANYIQCGERPSEIFPELDCFTDYLHIKDAILSDGSIVPAGEGDGNLPEIIDLFHRDGETRLLTVEPHLYVFAGLANLQGEALKHRFSYHSADEAFDAACGALKKLLDTKGYTY